MASPQSFLIIQTAFIGDVILATALVEKLNDSFPESSIDFLLRKGNEGLLQDHPILHSVLVWDKKKSKIKNLIGIIKQVRARRYDCIINVHRFASSGFITAFSGANQKIGFDKNPLSFLYDIKVKHQIGNSIHEVQRNQMLISSLTNEQASRPKLYPSQKDVDKIKSIVKSSRPYICIAPTSVWFTKQFPLEKWVELTNQLDRSIEIFLLGAPGDQPACESIKTYSRHPKVINLSGQLAFLESTALMKGALMNYVNDSAPMHIASAVNAPVTAVYCSTVPAFGFGPLSDRKFVIETREKLSCRPCGLHGFKVCPQGHFKCATTIEIADLKEVLN
jgi:heptosyltransferase-2